MILPTLILPALILATLIIPALILAPALVIPALVIIALVVTRLILAPLAITPLRIPCRPLARLAFAALRIALIFRRPAILLPALRPLTFTLRPVAFSLRPVAVPLRPVIVSWPTLRASLIPPIVARPPVARALPAILILTVSILAIAILAIAFLAIAFLAAILRLVAVLGNARIGAILPVAAVVFKIIFELIKRPTPRAHFFLPNPAVVQHAKIMVRMLQIIFRSDPVAGLVRIARQHLVFLQKLARVAAHPHFQPVRAALPARCHAHRSRIVSAAAPAAAPAPVLPVLHKVQVLDKVQQGHALRAASLGTSHPQTLPEGRLACAS